MVGGVPSIDIGTPCTFPHVILMKTLQGENLFYLMQKGRVRPELNNLLNVKQFGTFLQCEDRAVSWGMPTNQMVDFSLSTSQLFYFICHVFNVLLNIIIFAEGVSLYILKGCMLNHKILKAVAKSKMNTFNPTISK